LELDSGYNVESERRELAMEYRGHVKNGVVVLDDPVDLPEGVEVRIELGALTGPEATEGRPDDERPTLYERLKPVIGMAKGLPSDLARNHDHYLHGRPKQ